MLQICRVRQTETRILWSYSLSDKTVKIWVKESSEDLDLRQVDIEGHEQTHQQNTSANVAASSLYMVNMIVS